MTLDRTAPLTSHTGMAAPLHGHGARLTGTTRAHARRPDERGTRP